MPPTTYRLKKADPSANQPFSLRDNDVYLAKTADELRQMYRFHRNSSNTNNSYFGNNSLHQQLVLPMPDLDRKISYVVEGRVPISVSSALKILKKSRLSEFIGEGDATTTESSNKTTKKGKSKTTTITSKKQKASSSTGSKRKSSRKTQPSSSDDEDSDESDEEDDEDFFSLISQQTRTLPIDVLAPEIQSNTKQTLEAIRCLKRIRLDKKEDFLDEAMSNSTSDDEEEEEESDESESEDEEENENENGNSSGRYGDDAIRQENNRRVVPRNGPESNVLAQSAGTFVFSRMNSIRNFAIVNDGLKQQQIKNSSSLSNNNSTIGNSNNASLRSNVGQIKSEIEINNNSSFGTSSRQSNNSNKAERQQYVPSLQKVLPMIQTLPLRVHTQRTSQVVHEIASLLALLHEIE